MKATKFLFVMAMAAGLAACTKELVEPGKPVDSIEEVKGAKVIANGFSINPNASDLQTKIAIGADGPTWTNGDLAGVAWFPSSKAPFGEQEGVKLSAVSPTPLANHKLQYDERFKSNGNVFEGWHIAYYPYVEMKKPTQIKGLEVNPVLTANLNEPDQYIMDRYENAPLFSGAYMVTEDYVVDGLVTFNMPLCFVVNDLIFDLHVAESFGSQIQALQVESIELSSKNKPLFFETLSLNPTKKFPEVEPDQKVVFTADHFGLEKAFYGDEYVQTSTTFIDEANKKNYTLGAGNLRIRMFVAPVNPNPVDANGKGLTISDLSLRVNLVGGSYFELKAPKDQLATNYATFKKLYEAFTAGWKDDEGNVHDLRSVDNAYIRLPFELTPADFHISSKNVYVVEKGESSDADLINMNAAVELARQAGAKTVSLSFEPGIQILYSDIDFVKNPEKYEGMVLNCSSSKTGATFVISDKQTWNSNIVLGNYMHVSVTNNGNLTIAENNTTISKKPGFKVANLANAGTLNVGKNVTIVATKFTNGGLINVSRGSVFTLPSSDAVENLANVVYTVSGTETVEAIDSLITYTNLATLIVNGVNGDEKWTLDGEANWGADGTYAGLTVQMTGSEISSGNNITVKNLTFEGSNTIKCGTLTVADALPEAPDYQPITTPAGFITKINAAVKGAVVANGTLTVGDVSSTLTVADRVKVEAGSVKGAATIGAGADVTVGSVKGAATISAGAKVEAVAFTKGVTVGKDADVTVTAAKVTSAAISAGLTIADGAKVNVFGKLTGASNAPISVAEDATLNVEGAVTATKGMTIGTNATVTIKGAVTIKDDSALNIVEAAGVTVTGDVTGAVTVEGTEVTVDGDVSGAVTVAEGSKLTVTGAIAGNVDVAEGSLTVTGSITGETVTVREGATLEANAVVAALTVKKDAKVTVSGIEGNVTATYAKSIVVGKDGIKADKINVAAETFTVNGNIEINAAADGDPEIVIEKNTTFELTGDITGPSVDLVVYGTAVLKNTNMRHEDKNTLRVEEGAIVIIDTFDMTAPKLQFGDIYNKGILNVVGPKYVYVYNLNMEGSQETSVDATLYYYETVTLGGYTRGTIKSAKKPLDGAGYEVIGDTYYVDKPNGLTNALASTANKFDIVLESDVTVNAGDFGTATEININANDKTITFHQEALGVNAITTNGATLKISNATIKVDGAGATSDYYNHNLVFNCPVEMNNVVTENAIQVDYAGKEICKFNKVTFKDHSTSYQNKEYYALWISPNGQTVELNECSFDMAYGETGKGGRGIKIYDKTISDVLGLTLTVKNTKFNTDAKAAVEVYTGKPIDITWVGGKDTYAGCKEYYEKPVWLSEDVKAISSDIDIVMQCINKIKVNGVSLTYDDIEK
jgi:hypothetical protein